MAVRLGERSFEEVLAEIDEVQRRLTAALEQTALRRNQTASPSIRSSSMPTAEPGAGGSRTRAPVPCERRGRPGTLTRM
jgi:hypothetical protein